MDLARIFAADLENRGTSQLQVTETARYFDDLKMAVSIFYEPLGQSPNPTCSIAYSSQDRPQSRSLPTAVDRALEQDHQEAQRLMAEDLLYIFYGVEPHHYRN